ncbi:hypothetical protein HT136_06475 [Novosphingobium profundi]|uniref:hypothetical protein n=1 Tax=Novosphingobium profundi TaxID=1774954 RepID=UPI001BD9B52D|nr:hypothetical protein [Novosphingobium profundi]MBT0668010.1 hypothetical protein [Novosphingobium profundi]
MMSFAANLVKARSHLVIVAGLITASALIASIEANEPGTLALRTFGHSALDPATQRAAAYAWAQIPAEQRTPELEQIAARLGAETAPAPALGPKEAEALLRTLAVREAQDKAKAGAKAKVGAH